MSELRAPKVLDAIADLVLAYKPKPKSKPAKKRKKQAKKLGRLNRSLENSELNSGAQKRDN